MQTHDRYAALRLRDYRLLLSGSFLANLATPMQSMAIGFEIYQRTGSKLDLGLVGLAQFLPVLCLALFAGHTIDRYSRKHVLVSALGFHVAASLGLFAVSFNELPVGIMFVFLVAIGMARAFAVPARTSLLAHVVPISVLPNAVMWNTTAWQLATVSGPAFAGLLLTVASPAFIYLLAGSCTLTSACLVSCLRPRPVEGPATARSLSALLAGARFVWESKLILAAMTLDLFAVLLGGANALLPVFARDILDVGPQGLGLLEAAPAVGALIMAITVAHRPPFRRAGLTLLFAVAGFGIATIVLGLSTHFLLSLAMLLLLGAFDNISVVVRQTLMQVLTPDDMRGRVAAVNTIFISSSNELGAFESGTTAHWFGPVASVVLGGVGTLLVVAGVALWRPELVRLGSLARMREAKAAEASAPHQVTTG